jgi:hypothetical protein
MTSIQLITTLYKQGLLDKQTYLKELRDERDRLEVELSEVKQAIYEECKTENT